jgi:hypothetical protein
VVVYGVAHDEVIGSYWRMDWPWRITVAGKKTVRF